MESIAATYKDKTIHIEDFPDAVKLIHLKPRRYRRVADLALHKLDLDFADRCLIEINSTTSDREIARQALWRSAIVHYMKCFSTGARSKLDENAILKDQPLEAKQIFHYFKSLRNKHVVHDESAYLQCVPGAALNADGKACKIAKVICTVVRKETLEQDAYSNLKLLIEKTTAYVIAEFDRECDRIAQELEALPYSELLEMDSAVITTPAADAHKRNRNDDQSKEARRTR